MCLMLKIYQQFMKFDMKQKLCKCGCGKNIEIKNYHKYRGISDYIWGHNKGSKGTKHSEKTKKLLSIMKKGKHYSPETEFKKGSKINVGRKRPDLIKRNLENNPMHMESALEKMRNSEYHRNHGMEKHPNWQGGKSFEPYTPEFNEKLKKQIRKHYHYRCQQCFRHQDELRNKTNRKYNLQIHHIDYNKKNDDFSNLVPLCMNCHSQTNFKREDWVQYFKNKACEI